VPLGRVGTPAEAPPALYFFELIYLIYLICPALPPPPPLLLLLLLPPPPPPPPLREWDLEFLERSHLHLWAQAAGGVLMLASPHAAYITGHTLEVTGGAGI
jgi:hypothetical protein